MVSYDVTSLFTCITIAEQVKTVTKTATTRQHAIRQNHLQPGPHICAPLDLCLNTTYFKHSERFYRQKYGCTIGLPVSPIQANLYMDKVESRALRSFRDYTQSLIQVCGCYLGQN